MPTKSNRRSPRRKLTPPPKPYEGFPLSPHASGKYQKMVKGKIHYFGAWAKRVNGEMILIEDGWESALAEFNSFKAKQDRADKALADAKEEHELKRQKAELEKQAAEKNERDQRVGELRNEVEQRTNAEGGPLRVAKLCNLFRTKKQKQMKRQELSQDTYDDYVETTDLLLSVWGKHQIVDELGPAKFSEVRDAMSAKWKSPGRIAKFITMTRTVFNIAYEDQWIERIPNYGSDFKRPLAKRFKQYKQEGGDKLFTRDEVLLLLNGAAIKGKGGVKTVVKPTTQMKCMIYLGINCGFGNTDVARMPLTACDLKAHMVRFPRPKTGEPRECPLWPETVRAIEDVIAERSETELPNLFLTKYGNPWVVGKWQRTWHSGRWK